MFKLRWRSECLATSKSRPKQNAYAQMKQWCLNQLEINIIEATCLHWRIWRIKIIKYPISKKCNKKNENQTLHIQFQNHWNI
jgi:hypothetical protein